MKTTKQSHEAPRTDPVYIHTDYQVYDENRQLVSSHPDVDEAREHCPENGFVREAALFEYTELGNILHGTNAEEKRTIREWVPTPAHGGWPGPEPGEIAIDDATKQGAIIIDLPDDTRAVDSGVLWRALKTATKQPLVNAAPEHASQDWYKKLDRIVSMKIEWRDGDERDMLTRDRMGKTRRVDEINVHAMLATGKTRTYSTDLAIANDYNDATVEGVLMTKKPPSDLDVKTLTDLLHAMTFDPVLEAGMDSIDTQEADHQQDAHYTAASLLLDEDSKTTAVVAYAFNRFVGYLVPAGQGIRAKRPKKGEEFEIKLTPCSDHGACETLAASS